ncbi:MAG: 8-oxo-dGTP diphosphatase MutT [Deltaproteobacteria bacterium]|nr:8-oxo-dGTP diphosphatase MutT [Deltaproteobacteria bacterium]
MREITAVAGILRRNGEFLAVRRPEGKVMAGYWEFPGGKIEPGETPFTALRRELEEELGIRVDTADFWQTSTHAYAHGRVTLHVFLVRTFGGEPAPMENQELRWVTPQEAQRLNFLPADLPILRELARR